MRVQFPLSQRAEYAIIGTQSFKKTENQVSIQYV